MQRVLSVAASLRTQGVGHIAVFKARRRRRHHRPLTAALLTLPATVEVVGGRRTPADLRETFFQSEPSDSFSWVNDELNGYGKDKAIPHYRITRGRVVGNVQNIAMIYNQPTFRLVICLRNCARTLNGTKLTSR